MAKSYNYRNMGKLMNEGFSDSELREFIFYEPDFQPVYDSLSPEWSRRELVLHLIEHARMRSLEESILKWAKETNAVKYREYQPYFEGEVPARTEPGTAPAAEAPTQTAGGTAPPNPQPAVAPTDLPQDTPQGTDIFISYSRRDLEFVTHLYQELAQRGISAWFDKTDIKPADHWRTDIVEGIRDCKAFVLVLSPDSAASVNVRKEVDLAERYKKQILPLMWRTTEIPVAMEYQLAGIQWIDFKQTGSAENFNQLADVLRPLIGGASLVEAARNKPIVQAPVVPAIVKEAAPAGPKKLGAPKLVTVNPIAVQGAVISGVITTSNLDQEDQDRLIAEWQWLFNAADLLLQIRNGSAAATQPVAVDVPATAEKKNSRANNQVLNPSYPGAFAGQVGEILKRIKTHLGNLDLVLARQAQLGEAAAENLSLQHEIKGARLAIVKELDILAQLMNQAYGILVTSPRELVEFLGA